MPDFKEAKIYKITADGFDPYYGSTTLSLDLRFRIFKYTKLKYSCSPFIHLESCRIELVELYPCNERKELLLRERYWIENNKCVNIVKPVRTKSEEKTYHRKYMKEYMKTYKIINPPKTTKEQQSLYNKRCYEKRQLYLGWLKDFINL